jgi:hypothetical protein
LIRGETLGKDLRKWINWYIVGSVPSKMMVETPTTTDQTTNDLKILPLDGDKTTTILLNVEEGIKSLIQKLAKRVEIGNSVDITEEQLSSLPTSITGVIVHFITKGLESEFGIGFENEPRSLKVRGIASNYDKKVAGKKRLLTRDQKNELLAKTSMTYYETKIASGEMTIDNVMYAIKDAFERKKNFEEMGYILPPEKTKYPYWEGGEGE